MNYCVINMAIFYYKICYRIFFAKVFNYKIRINQCMQRKLYRIHFLHKLGLIIKSCHIFNLFIY
jgi:hypothetical protein